MNYSTNRKMNVLILILISTFTTGCVSSKPIKQTIPPIYTQDCVKPMIQGSTYKDLINAYIERGKAIEDCNADKKALREFQK